ncbi:MAG: UvrD-helicase domain-containing protein [Eggerthellaceae bacterium]|nr:UvrD-helicase domain-containing protein [Eggerthellaceae bacterium]
MLDLSTLNEAQKEAVESLGGPLLVLAGAGSGKTSVLTHRLANLLVSGITNPWNIMAITFTRKAASEMRDRVKALLGNVSSGIWIGTFHHVCVRILRTNALRIGFSDQFTIYGTDDTNRIVSSILDELNINSKAFTPNSVRTMISAYKNSLILPEKVDILTPVDDVTVKVYEHYQERLRELNAMDYDDLLMNTYLLFKQNKDILAIYQERFIYILVDEYQDTNKAQFKIVAMLAAPQNNLMVVGDDDQSIYSWRGADMTNILNFEHLYPDAKVVKLEQNYRSTRNILDAANNVIKHNVDRKPKKLFTDSEAGDKVGVYNASDNLDEGRWIASEIRKYNRRGIGYNNMAIFYRTNAQSRSLEDMLLRAGVPYIIVGGLKFFERAEIRNLLAYLYLTVNSADNVACQRIINVPRRKIGNTTIHLISEIAEESELSFFEACTAALDSDRLKSQSKAALTNFIKIILDCHEINALDISLHDKVDKILEKSGLLFALEAEETNEAKERTGNLKEFIGVVEEFEATYSAEEEMYEVPSTDSVNDLTQEPKIAVACNSLNDFIDWIQLRTDIDTIDLEQGAVSLMTIHAAKGLEFDYVFVAGMEDGLFPLYNAKLQHKEDEERRLAYVAFTRARKKLFLTYAQKRKIYGDTQYNMPSPYITDIPKGLRNNLGVGSFNFSGTGFEKRGDRRGILGSGKRSSSSYAASQNKIASSFFDNSISVEEVKDREFVKGDHIIHKVFGKGVVLSQKKDLVTVKFSSNNVVKEFVLGFAPIKKID